MAISCCNCIRHSLSSSHSWLRLYPYLLAASCYYCVALFHVVLPFCDITHLFASNFLVVIHSFSKCIKGQHVPPFFQQGSNSYKPLLQHNQYQEVTLEGGGNEFTGEITLRPLYLSDIDDFMVWATDDEVAPFCTWDACTSKEDALNFIKNKIIPHPWFRAICLNDKPIGAISVTRFSGYDECRGELGYALAHKYWGKGIATKGVKLVANTIFSEWPHLERLEALAAVENVGSQRVLEKAGFQREGILRKYMVLKGKTRDLVMYSLLSTDPRS